MAEFGVSRRFVLRAGAAAVAAAMLAACEKKPSFNSTDVSGSDLGTDLSLTDFNGQPRTLQDFKGKVLVVFFGFVQCPDVCPTALAEFVQVKNSLGKDGDRLQVAFVTVDPERDTPEILRAYVTQFDPSFLGLRGDADATARVAKSFKVFYAKVPGKEPGSYTMDHTAGVYIYDPEGHLRLFARHTAGADALTSDIRQLL
ncbi:SCO family protein [Pigmentiphaga sp.]|uniref:SCO family protein n=1 Tax=Pigmentiphaga sp. TaxID=1977564 RepID=UPI00128BCF1A|nr:SCO family protein [Pigmentiphaga sp.]MPS25344.1 SCO family protein [Alcaligenaceae bacterium SAGV5]MPS53958.1 SCO family protein [Alcaligenaceae bacterium SAGV3]MPT59070.1 SCO family protein [Alcaligenaceae bacterium]